MHIWGAHVHMYTKYEVCMSNPDDANRQSMIVKGSLVDKPNEPKTKTNAQFWRKKHFLHYY